METPKVLTMGTFDLMHYGHIYLFQQCFKIGNLTVAVNNDEFVSRFKKPPVQSFAERKAMVESCKYVAYVMENFGNEDAKPVIEKVAPDFLIIGSDWAPPKDYHAQLNTTPQWLYEHGVTLLYLERHLPYSSTELKGRML